MMRRCAWLVAVFALRCCRVVGDVDVDTQRLRPNSDGSGSNTGSEGVAGGPGSTSGSGSGAVGSAGSDGSPSAGVEGSCNPGSVRCDGAALQLCSPDGARWITTS